MNRRTGTLVLLLTFAASSAPATAEIERGGGTVEVIDMHLHPGSFARFSPEGREFIIGSLPPFVRAYAPSILNILSDPWTEHIGIRAQTEMAGVDQAVLYAVYAPETTGVFSNRELQQVLTDPRNRRPDGSPWAYGFASIDFTELTADAAEAERRLSALGSYIEAAPELFIGIKLAHTHQGVALDDEAYFGVYDVAAAHDVPVLLHTGFSPFPGTVDEPSHYDPSWLETIVAERDDVTFVLSHVGQGDARATAAALDLAAAHANVYLEISALGPPLRIDAEGNEVEGEGSQLPGVMAAIAARSLQEKTFFASDGPQSSGKVRAYLGEVVEAAERSGWTEDQIRGLLADNFRRVYLDAPDD